MTDITVREEPVKPLSTREKMKLAELERRIVIDFGAFFRVGQAMAEINELGLYRETHRTFEAYCKNLWDMGRRHAYQLIRAAETFDHLKLSFEGKMCAISAQNQDQVIDLLPINEAQVRPLTKLRPDQQIAVWRAVVENSGEERKITASLVKKTVKAYLGEKVTATIRNAQAKVAADRHISSEFRDAFDTFIEQTQKAKGEGYKTTSRQMVVKCLDQLRAEIAEDGDKIEDQAFTGGTSDANKVERAGFKLFRADRSNKTIKTRSETGSWIKHSGPYTTYKEMEAEFAVIMQDEKHLQG